MNFSPQTLADCFIKNNKSDSGPIVDLFNFTRTTGGHARLVSFFSTKANSVEEISSIQQTLLHISSHLSEWDLGISNTDIYYMHEYFKLHQRFFTFNNKNNLLKLKVLIKKPLYYDTISSGVNSIQRFLKIITEKIGVITSKIPRNSVIDLNKTITILNLPSIREIIQADIYSVGRYKVLQFDHFLRYEFKPDFDILMDQLYEIEAYFSLAMAIQKYKLSFPRVSTTKNFNIEGAWNPLIKNCVKNDLNYSTFKNIIFLTGPNMAGKSTYLRTMGLIVSLAHMGLAVPAKQASIPFFDDIDININVQDNMAEGYSNFYSELKKVKSIATNLNQQKKCFVIFDELFKGTNLTDLTNCSAILLKGFLHYEGSFFIISSHHLQVLDQIDNKSSLQYKHVEVLFDKDEPRFTYLIKNGLSNVNLGLYFFHKEGIAQLLS